MPTRNNPRSILPRVYDAGPVTSAHFHQFALARRCVINNFNENISVIVKNTL